MNEKKCFILDPCDGEARHKIHWVAHDVTNDTIIKAFEGFDEVQEVDRDLWQVPGFEYAESSARTVRMSLRLGVSLETLLHQLQLPRGTALVAVPGRALLYLRCRRATQVREDCVFQMCDSRHNFDHTKEDIVCTYATAITEATVVSASEDVMDEAYAEVTSRTVHPESEDVVKRPSGRNLLSETAVEVSDGAKMADDAATSEASAVAVKSGASGGAGKPKAKIMKKPTKTRSRYGLPAGKTKSRPSSPGRHDDMNMAVAAVKSNLELESSASTPEPNKDQRRTLGPPKRSRIHLATNIAKETRRKPSLRI